MHTDGSMVNGIGFNKRRNGVPPRFLKLDNWIGGILG
jgi:hypothetical protein